MKRQGLDRASKRDITYCTTWLRANGWRRVEKRQPDGQKVVVWRAPDGQRERSFQSDPSTELGSALAESEGVAAGGSGQATQVAGSSDDGFSSAEGVRPTQVRPKKGLGSDLKQDLIDCATYTFRGETVSPTQNNLYNDLPGEIFSKEGAQEFSYVTLLGENCLGGTSLDGLSPATLDQLEAAFPRDRFLALDIETSGLSAVSDGVRTVQFADGEKCRPSDLRPPRRRHALWLYWPIFSRGRRVVVHNARFEGSWFRQAGIDVVLDDTALLFSAVRGMRHPGKQKDKYRDQGGGRISLADLVLMVLNETLDKSEQTSDWSLPTLTSSQLTYALTDAIVTHRLWEALWSELQVKSRRVRRRHRQRLRGPAFLRCHGARHGAGRVSASIRLLTAPGWSASGSRWRLSKRILPRSSRP